MINNNENKLENRVYDFSNLLMLVMEMGKLDELWK